VIGAKRGLNFFPLDIELGLFADGFSPKVISLVTRLATRVSQKSSTLICSAFLNWSPSQRSVGELVLGLGRHADAYMESVPVLDPPKEGQVIVIELDGKATPTATAAELDKRRQPRKPVDSTSGCQCGCQRHRGKARRACNGKRKRRKKGDKSKNGRSITLVAVYVLERREDGLLHGPLNKRIWGSYASRVTMMDWAKAEVVRRGFDPNGSNIHILSDGETTFHKRMSERFPNATHALDVRHVEEKIWDVGRLFHSEGSEELNQWVETQRELLYKGKASLLIERLKRLRRSVAQSGPGTKAKRQKLDEVAGYLEKRQHMMRYDQLLEQDLVIASGVIEGAVRHVIGERMDCAGMRWIPGRAEMLLHLRCIELNGEWDRFFHWARDRIDQTQREQLMTVKIRTDEPVKLPGK
jgi:hypothetical protein